MKTIIEGKLKADGLKVAIIGARFNEFITSKLIDGAYDCFYRHGGAEDAIDQYWVPGAYEIPLIASKLAKTKKYAGIVCVGAVIRGSTPHFEYVSSEVAKGIAHVSLDTDVPVIFGVLTTDSIEQAIERAGTKAGNKGWDAMMSCIEMCDLIRKI
ncbi:MAG: 6,7-dimethyl-8-ribityllumazine synthase [Candidatus Delongbacteria bacterium]|nr:6,7-dimethyl-8-ribityllumazine synthase [Candidatus Delongbacteria bacterium]MBN2834625.1 6,7-dimethyl-8-ribityllumazine synthase [Candidatus Delongbacteria bacterium]